MERPQEGYDSTQGLGTQVPSEDGLLITSGGVGVPLGNLTNSKGGYLNYNEFIVYDPARVRIRYLVMVRLH